MPTSTSKAKVNASTKTVSGQGKARDLRQQKHLLILDDRVEAAASGVVANEKQKQAEEARLKAAKVAAQTKQIEAQTFANPALLEIKRLELQLKIERDRSEGIKNHQGPLTIIYGQPGVQLQVPTAK